MTEPNSIQTEKTNLDSLYPNQPNFVDSNEYLKNSPSLKRFVSNSMKPEPPDMNSPDLTWEYTPESLVTEIVRVVGKARRAMTNPIMDMESRLHSYSGEVIGDIGAKLDALTREEFHFCKRVQDIRSTFTSDFEQEFMALVYRLKKEPKDHMSCIHKIFNNLHHQELQLYLVQ